MILCFTNPGELDPRFISNLIQGWPDLSRSLQNWLFEQLIHREEQLQGDPL